MQFGVGAEILTPLGVRAKVLSLNEKMLHVAYLEGRFKRYHVTVQSRFCQPTLET